MSKKEKSSSTSSNEQDPASDEGAGSDSGEAVNPEVESAEVSGEVSERDVLSDNNPTVPGNEKLEDAKNPVPVDMVKIQVNKRVECAIGPKFYSFVLGKNYIVSKTVHRILVDRGVVKPTY